MMINMEWALIAHNGDERNDEVIEFNLDTLEVTIKKWRPKAPNN